MTGRRKFSDRFASSKYSDIECMWSGDWSVME
jgi:hypothetical protein